MQHILLWYFRNVHHALVAQIGEVVGACHHIVTAADSQPQVNGVTKDIALDIHEAVAELHTVDCHLFPQRCRRGDGVRFFLKQIVNALAESLHPRLEVTTFRFFTSVLHRHLSDGFGTELSGTINRRDGESYLWVSRHHDTRLKRTTAHHTLHCWLSSGSGYGVCLALLPKFL